MNTLIRAHGHESGLEGVWSEEEHVARPTVPAFQNNRRKVALTLLRRGRTLKVRFQIAQGTEMGSSGLATS